MENLKMKVFHNALVLYNTLCEIGRSSFSQLQKTTGLGDSDLCFAICFLLQNKTISQSKINGVIYYEVLILHRKL